MALRSAENSDWDVVGGENSTKIPTQGKTKGSPKLSNWSRIQKNVFYASKRFSSCFLARAKKTGMAISAKSDDDDVSCLFR